MVHSVSIGSGAGDTASTILLKEYPGRVVTYLVAFFGCFERLLVLGRFDFDLISAPNKNSASR
jgi:hypothetical protein